MRNVFSRRDFLKASAAAVLAASAAGVLPGCDGGGSEIPSATIGLGEFEVTINGSRPWKLKGSIPLFSLQSSSASRNQAYHRVR